jgi:hypothetical protein
MRVKLLKKVRKYRSYVQSEDEQHARLLQLMLIESLGYAQYQRLRGQRDYKRYLRRKCTASKVC